MKHRLGLYALARPALFALDAEVAHELTIKTLSRMPPKLAARLMGAKRIEKPVEVMGLRFPNPVGLAAGLDKNAECIDQFAAMGFGFIEVGTVTPRPQPGNPRPRLFRLPEHQALINRMGFNSDGVEKVVERLKKRKTSIPVGVNIGKNRDTDLENALVDYLICLKAVYPVADYITVNISSPNTPGLRELQSDKFLHELLHGLKNEQHALYAEHKRYVPLAVKVAPDLDDDEIKALSRSFIDHKIDAVIATNTTISRDGIDGLNANERGGLSGRPLQIQSTQVVEEFHKHLGKRIPIIGVGGIDSSDAAIGKRDAGASLVQIYTGFIYHGPALAVASVACW